MSSQKNRKRRIAAQFDKNAKVVKVEQSTTGSFTSRRVDGQTANTLVEPSQAKAYPSTAVPQLAPLPLSAALSTEFETESEQREELTDGTKATQVCLHFKHTSAF